MMMVSIERVENGYVLRASDSTNCAAETYVFEGLDSLFSWMAANMMLKEEIAFAGGRN